MHTTQIIYIVFGIVLLAALIFDLGILSKRNADITIKKAFLQTAFWVILSLAFWGFIWWEKGGIIATKYISAYLMEWSLSIDNIFVFILIFSFFRVNKFNVSRALLIGILLAIVLRILFIAVGIELINHFHWLLYVFGFFLLYTGYKLFFQEEDKEYKPEETAVYKFVRKVFRITNEDPHGRYFVTKNGKVFFTSLSLVVIMLATTDLVFALDSIPTVVSLVREKANQPFSADDILVIYSSNIFAVLGLRSLYFLLQGAVDKFSYLQQGIAVVLMFIGLKMLVEFFEIQISIYISLVVIVCCIGGSMLFSKFKNRQK
ncbi:MAG: TerC/Alx family metal homeostasis membrane protein [Ilyomonas sp.]